MAGTNGFRKTTWQCMGNACAYARKSEPEYCPCTITTPTDTLFYALDNCLYDRDRKVQWAAVPKVKKGCPKCGSPKARILPDPSQPKDYSVIKCPDCGWSTRCSSPAPGRG